MDQKDRRGSLAPAWFRRQWKKLLAIAEDYPLVMLLGFATVLVPTVFYLTTLGGLNHFRESFERWRVESFGGVHEVDRSVRMPDVILSLKPRGYDRLDVLSMTNIYLGGVAFREELRVLAGRGGIIRIVILDPRVSDPDSPQSEEFLGLAAAFGKTPQELTAQCWYSTAVVLSLVQQLGDGLQVRMLREPLSSESLPYFVPGKSSRAYLSSNSGDCLDVIVPDLNLEEGLSSLARPGMVIIDRIEHPVVRQFREAFDQAWERGIAIDSQLEKEFSERLYAKKTR